MHSIARRWPTESLVAETAVRFGGVTTDSDDVHAEAVLGQSCGVLRDVAEPEEAHGLALQHRHDELFPLARRLVALQFAYLLVEVQRAGQDVFG